MPFEFLADDIVLLGVGAFAREFRAELAALDPRPTIVDLRQYPFAGRNDDPLIERISSVPVGRLLLIGYIGNRNHVGPMAAPAMDEMLKQGVPGSFGPSRLAVLAKEARGLGLQLTALRHVIRSGQERQGCLSGPSQAGAGIEELQSFARVLRFGAPHPDFDALVLKSGPEKVIQTTTLHRVPEAIARFDAGAGATATLICRPCANPLESKYIDPDIVDACAEKCYSRLSFVGGEIVFENWPRVQRTCAQSGLQLYRFWD